MPDPSVRIIKFDAGSTTDQTLSRLQDKLDASSSVEAMRRGIAIADTITDFTKNGQKVYVKGEDGTLRELLIS